MRNSSDRSCYPVISRDTHHPGLSRLLPETAVHAVYVSSGQQLTNCPCISPHTVTGHRTGWTFDSSINTSLAYKEDSKVSSCQQSGSFAKTTWKTRTAGQADTASSGDLAAVPITLSPCPQAVFYLTPLTIIVKRERPLRIRSSD